MTNGLRGDALIPPTVMRNRDPILDVLRRILPSRGRVLEIASGSGAHAAHFAAGLPHIIWQPTDRDDAGFGGINAHRHHAQLANFLPPIVLDASADSWPVAAADAVVSINMIHIAPWSAAQGLIAGAARILSPGGVLFLYGPFQENGQHTAPSNAAFDADLKARNAQWGVRDLTQVRDLARAHGFDFSERVAMPANNLSVVFRRAA